MKSTPHVLILQTESGDGPSYLTTFLQQRSVAFEVRCVAHADAIPDDPGTWTHIAMLGGPMSVNDPLPFLAEMEALLRKAVARDVPVLGHCLGGQMLAKALGAVVREMPQPEIGWTRIEVENSDEARALARTWLGDAPAFHVYEWHFQTFEVPAGATLLAGSPGCRHQAFACGPHLGMQFHIEVDAEKLGRWTAEAPVAGDPLLAHPHVQPADAMAADTTRWLAESQRTAAHIYAHWLGLH